MNNKVVYAMYQSFVKRGFSTLRFNFRGVGRSQSTFDNGLGEMSDAASALDWMQAHNPNAHSCWIGGFSFGAWIAMQLMMRRPEISGFLSLATPASQHDFSFLAPCPADGLIVHGEKDEIIPVDSVAKLAAKLKAQSIRLWVVRLLHFRGGEGHASKIARGFSARFFSPPLTATSISCIGLNPSTRNVPVTTGFAEN